MTALIAIPLPTGRGIFSSSGRKRLYFRTVTTPSRFSKIKVRIQRLRPRTWKEGGSVRTIVIDMQSTLVSRAFECILRQKMRDCNPIVSERPEDTAEQCRLFRPYALLMEVTGYTPWMLEERLRICEMVRNQGSGCKFVFAVDENAEPELAGRVTQCKKDGRIDAFIYNSTSERYLAAVLDSL